MLLKCRENAYHRMKFKKAVSSVFNVIKRVHVLPRFSFAQDLARQPLRHLAYVFRGVIFSLYFPRISFHVWLTMAKLSYASARLSQFRKLYT